MIKVYYLNKYFQFVIQLTYITLIFAFGLPVVIGLIFNTELSILHEAITGIAYGIPISLIFTLFFKLDWVKIDSDRLRIRNLFFLYSSIHLGEINKVSEFKILKIKFLEIKAQKKNAIIVSYLQNYGELKSYLDAIIRKS